MAITATGASNYMEMVTPIMPMNLMGEKGKFDDFIGVWDNFMPSALCNDLLNWFHTWQQQAIITNNERDVPLTDPYEGQPYAMPGGNQFKTRSLGRNDLGCMLDSLNGSLSAQVNQYLQATLNHYCTVYDSLGSVPLTSWHVKMQQTPEGGGYHVFHHEDGSYNEAHRTATWMIYLNEDFEGGETEFFYQKRRIKPTTGTVVIWPAGYTHTHRGNLVLKGTKYIITGWFYQQPV
tara:strand:+ start:85 stop:786 length:702 start_codon:yes stop_codon:yes gene_type:complete